MHFKFDIDEEVVCTTSSFFSSQYIKLIIYIRKLVRLMNNKQIKERFIEALFSRNIYTRIVHDGQYVTRCPYCGDSMTNLSKGHFYIKANINDNSSIVYNCFRCPANGVLTKETMERLEISDPELIGGITYLNNTADKYNKREHQITDELMFFDYSIPEPKNYKKIQYIEYRLGYRFSSDELKKIKVVTSLRDFLRHNNINTLQCPDKMAYLMERDYVGFLSLGNSHLLFRDVTETHEPSWIKYPLTKESMQNRIFYSIASSIDIYTTDTLTVNLFEGVFCALSIGFNFGECRENAINIVIGGKYYENIIAYLIKTGIVGANVEVNVYADNDKEFNPKNVGNDTELEYYERLFRNYKYLFKKVTIIYNRKGKDYGVPKDKILMEYHKI